MSVCARLLLSGVHKYRPCLVIWLRLDSRPGARARIGAAKDASTLQRESGADQVRRYLTHPRDVAELKSFTHGVDSDVRGPESSRRKASLACAPLLTDGPVSGGQVLMGLRGEAGKPGVVGSARLTLDEPHREHIPSTEPTIGMGHALK